MHTYQTIQVRVGLVIKIDLYSGMEEILLLRIGFNLEIRRLSRLISRSNLELPER